MPIIVAIVVKILTALMMQNAKIGTILECALIVWMKNKMHKHECSECMEEFSCESPKWACEKMCSDCLKAQAICMEEFAKENEAQD